MTGVSAADDDGGAGRFRLPSIVVRWFDPKEVGLRQIAFTVTYMFVLVVVLTTTTPQGDPLLVAGFVLVMAVQLVASLRHWHGWTPWHYVLPLAQMVALVLLEVGAGVEHSYFLSLVFIPVANLALQPGLLGTVLAIAGASVLVVTGVLVVPGVDETPAVVRIAVLIVVTAFVALGTHGATDVLRRQAAELAAARDELAARARQLAESRDVLRSVMVAATEQAVLATDAGGTVVAVSTGAVRMFERPEQDLLGTSVLTLFAPPEGEPAPDGVESVSAAATRLAGATTAGPVATERTITRADGTRRAVDIVVTRRPPLSDEPDAQPGYLVVATDVTERHEAERLQDEFIGLVTHDLRTPLSSILGYVELLQLGGAMPGEDKNYVDVIDRNARRLLRMVDDLLTSVQLSAGEFTFLDEEVDVVGIVREAATDVGLASRRAGVEVSVGGDAAVPLRSDPERLGQLVGNLLVNGVKFNHRGGSVSVDVTGSVDEQGRRHARVVVSDTGNGIAPDELSRITERFYRAREARRRRVRGVGMGLSVVEALVEAHGGTLDIRSQPGEGTVVDVDLPDLPAAFDAGDD